MILNNGIQGAVGLVVPSYIAPKKENSMAMMIKDEPLLLKLSVAVKHSTEVSYQLQRMATDLCGAVPESDETCEDQHWDESVAGRIEQVQRRLNLANARASDAIRRIRERFSMDENMKAG